MKATKDYGVAFSWFGIIGVATFIIAWICAASIDTAWEFGVNTLSEFGISNTDARFYFNYGCMITGALIALFGFGHAVSAKNAGHTAGGVLFVIGGVFLALIGIVTMDVGNGNLHNYVAISSALFLFMGMIAVGAGNWFSDQKMFGGITVIFACMFVAMFFAYDVAKIEAYGIILAMIWFLIESVRMIMTAKKN